MLFKISAAGGTDRFAAGEGTTLGRFGTHCYRALAKSFQTLPTTTGSQFLLLIFGRMTGQAAQKDNSKQATPSF